MGFFELFVKNFLENSQQKGEFLLNPSIKQQISETFPRIRNQNAAVLEKQFGGFKTLSLAKQYEMFSGMTLADSLTTENKGFPVDLFVKKANSYQIEPEIIELMIKNKHFFNDISYENFKEYGQKLQEFAHLAALVHEAAAQNLIHIVEAIEVGNNTYNITFDDFSKFTSDYMLRNQASNISLQQDLSLTDANEIVFVNESPSGLALKGENEHRSPLRLELKAAYVDGKQIITIADARIAEFDTLRALKKQGILDVRRPTIMEDPTQRGDIYIPEIQKVICVKELNYFSSDAKHLQKLISGEDKTISESLRGLLKTKNNVWKDINYASKQKSKFLTNADCVVWGIKHQLAYSYHYAECKDPQIFADFFSDGLPESVKKNAIEHNRNLFVLLTDKNESVLIKINMKK